MPCDWAQIAALYGELTRLTSSPVVELNRAIEHHVSAILTKLGPRSRAEAAAYAASIETTQPLKAEA